MEDSLLFARLDAYIERANDMLDFCRIVLDFSKLQKIYVGGTKGKELTASLWQIHSDFNWRRSTLSSAWSTTCWTSA